jgi:hypothetical protein
MDNLTRFSWLRAAVLLRAYCGIPLLSLSALLVSSQAQASHLCLGGIVPSGVYGLELILSAEPLLYGEVKGMWQSLGGDKTFGCLMSQEQETPEETASDTQGEQDPLPVPAFERGVYADFEKGQIVWSPDQRMTIAAYNVPGGGVAVHWSIGSPYHYDKIKVMWTVDGQYQPDLFNNETFHSGLKIGEKDVSGANDVKLENMSGRNRIIIEGCDNGGFLKGDRCLQGWSVPVYVDVDELDVAHKVDGNTPLEPVSTLQDTESNWQDRLLIAANRKANRSLSPDPTIIDVDGMLAKLIIGRHQTAGVCYPDNPLIKEVNTYLKNAVQNAHVGSDCPLQSQPGNYDFALRGLITIMYEFGRPCLRDDVYNHVLHDLLTENGGKVNTKACGGFVNETENHIMATESSRYLTNQLLLGTSDPALTPQFDNNRNGMEAWMLRKLQGFLMNDFHEFNSRPYAGLSSMAIHNLAEYAGCCGVGQNNPEPVKTAATMVMDYLSAKFAVGSNNLRRVAPFRRQDQRQHYTPVFGNNSDELTWQFLMTAGNTQLLDRMRYGRADWGAPGTMEFAGVGQYRVPGLILDLLMDKRDNPYFQIIRPDQDGLEIYASQAEFLITGGGVWAQDNYNGGTEHAPATATTLMPTLLDATVDPGSPSTGACIGLGGIAPAIGKPCFWGGTDRADFIRLAGTFSDENRMNTCVTDGFACGVNPIVPLNYLRRFKPGSRACPAYPPTTGCFAPSTCAISVFGKFQDKWQSLDEKNGPLGCPVAQAKIIGPALHHVGMSQDFEGGQMVYSPAIGIFGAPPNPSLATDFVQTVYFDHSNNIVFEWGDTHPFNYGRFLVRLDKDGTFYPPQYDVDVGSAKVSRTAGELTIAASPEGPIAGPGKYSVIVKGCDPHDPFAATCYQDWSNPAQISFPLPSACYAFHGDSWAFIDASPECGSAPELGYYVAVYSAPCTIYQCSNDRNGYRDYYGFFEATSSKGRSFGTFINAVLSKNGSTTFTPDGVNNYVTIDGRTISFTPVPPPYQLGVSAIKGERIDTNLADYPLASAENKNMDQAPINGDGKGCVVIRNHHLRQSLVLDMTNYLHPRRTCFPRTDRALCDTPVSVPNSCP